MMTQSASRNFMLEMSEAQRESEPVRTAFGCWNDVIGQLCDSAYQLRAIGEERQCEAMLIDAESMCRRARTHLNNLLRRQTVTQEEGAP